MDVGECGWMWADVGEGGWSWIDGQRWVDGQMWVDSGGFGWMVGGFLWIWVDLDGFGWMWGGERAVESAQGERHTDRQQERGARGAKRLSRS